MKQIILCALCLILLVGCSENVSEESVLNASDGFGVTSVADSETTNESSSEQSIESIAEGSYEQSEESISENTPDEETSNKYGVIFTEDMVRELKIEIYEEKSQELIKTMVVTDQAVCAKVFAAFDECFADLCEKYPRDAAPDMSTRTDYRVAVYLNTYQDSTKEKLAYYIDISYPYGYSNDIYRLMHHGGSPFGDYVARLGKPFIDMVDEYTKEYFANPERRF